MCSNTQNRSRSSDTRSRPSDARKRLRDKRTHPGSVSSDRKNESSFKVVLLSGAGSRGKVDVKACPFNPVGNLEIRDLRYIIQPRKKWASMTRYKSFILKRIPFYLNTFVYALNHVNFEEVKQEVAYILEIRAADPNNAFALVCWMYFPEALPEGTRYGSRQIVGRQHYHGQNEVIASSHMDIINVNSINGPADVVYLQEDNNEIQKELYWRFFYEYRSSELNLNESGREVKDMVVNLDVDIEPPVWRIEDMSGEEWTERVYCPICGIAIE
ncbi:hypothetical protein S40285_09694 [Stachybotrys chlorohalonatus IBT 40285]|uniref:BAH domain-containing protein n=1 Tax=Stachybotrys chlorohalonatus (strain IBT 40285) TaxID=1283841 RepID=A0A084QQG1_STAC4|nr:hypothetical protein S40285_09694 [Stachybotrys chlorohalonata IBT 40285]